MQLFAVGLSHKTTPVVVRERFARTGEEGGWPDRWVRLPGIHEAVVLDTCNRLEVYGVWEDGAAAGPVVMEHLARRGGMYLEDLEPYAYVLEGTAAVEHLFRVTCGLDAMVVGESQILGQVRRAYARACDRSTVGKMLHRLFQQALRVGKRAHGETAIGRHAASVSSAAVELAQKAFPELTGRVVMVIGAGETAELALASLHARGVRNVVVANRTEARALALAQRYHGRAVALADIPAYLPAVDIVISSTSSSGWVLTVETLRRAVLARHGPEALLLIDLAVPRDIEPAAAGLPGLHLHDIDAIAAAVAGNLAERDREVPRVEAIIAAEVQAFDHWHRALGAVPLIRALRGRAHRLREAELRRIFNRLPHLDDRQRWVIEGATAAMVNKLLHEPTLMMRRRAAEDHGEDKFGIVRDLFALEPDPVPLEGRRRRVLSLSMEKGVSGHWLPGRRRRTGGR